MKYHLRRIVGIQTFTYEELSTLLCQIEAVLNSRPLCPLTDDPNDLNVLTPGHFLIGHSLNLIPKPNLLDTNPSHLRRWQKIQHMTQQFWDHYLKSYLQRHQAVYKWNKGGTTILTNDIVLMIDERFPPLKWPHARVIETIPGSDGLVQVAKIRRVHGIKTRPLVKLCPLILSQV